MAATVPEVPMAVQAEAEVPTEFQILPVPTAARAAAVMAVPIMEAQDKEVLVQPRSTLRQALAEAAAEVEQRQRARMQMVKPEALIQLLTRATEPEAAEAEEEAMLRPLAMAAALRRTVVGEEEAVQAPQRAALEAREVRESSSSPTRRSS
jgi:hypothetical protein